MNLSNSLMRRTSIAVLAMVEVCGCSSVTAPSASGPAVPAGGTGFTTSASTQLWLRQFGTGTVLANTPPMTPTTGLFHDGDVLTGVTADSSGNAVVCGYTRGAFPGFSNPSHAPQDFLAKFDSTGKQLWLRQFGTGASDYLNAVTVDAHGNIFTAGFTTGSFAGANNPSGAPRAIVTKFDTNGNQIWLRQFTNGTGIAVRAITAAPNGTLLVAGALSQQTAQQPGEMQLLAQTAFISRMDGVSGQTLWQQTVAPAGISILNAIAADSMGNAFAVGEAIQTAAGQSSTGTFQLLALKLAAADGSRIWQQENIGNSKMASAALLTGAAVDGQNNLVVVGSQFGSDAICLLASLDKDSGEPVWISPFGGTTITGSGTVAVGAGGDIFTAGNTLAALVPSYQPNMQDVYVAQFNSAGQSQWVQQFGMLQETVEAGSVNFTVGPLPQGYWPQVATDPSGNLLVGGITTGQFVGFSNPHNAVEPFLAKFGP